MSFQVTSGRKTNRRSKACNNCRARRVRCVGAIPCKGCIENETASTCAVRIKARPHRAISAKIVPSDNHPISPQTSCDASTSTSHEILSVEAPLSIIDQAVQSTCSSANIPWGDISFDPASHLLSTDIPSPAKELDESIELETQLLGAIVICPDFYHLEWLDRPTIVSLYQRHRSIPGSLNDAQRALIHAFLCVVRYIQVRTDARGIFDGVVHCSDLKVEQHYYELACEELKDWRHPSLDAIWALLCLVTYTIACGGGNDSRQLVEKMAWHVEGLGIHQQMTAGMYPPQDRVDMMLAAFHYTDTQIASLLGLKHCISPTSIDIKPILAGDTFPEPLALVTELETRVLCDCLNTQVDTQDMAYVNNVEEQLEKQLQTLRPLPAQPAVKVADIWAELRLNWLRVLIHTPRMVKYKKNTANVARAVSQIIFSYSFMLQRGQYRTSWPQCRRIITCGQLLILLAGSGELQQQEAALLWGEQMFLLQQHLPHYPKAWQVIHGFQVAATKLGISPRRPLLCCGKDAQPNDSRDISAEANFNIFSWTGAMSGVQSPFVHDDTMLV